MKLKKRNILLKMFWQAIILTIILFPFSSKALANSGPVFWPGYPSLDMITVKENSPIVINEENLIFDFSNHNKFEYTMSGKVTAIYEMFNSTKKRQSVQMAFPFIGKMNNISVDDIVITADGSLVPYQIFIGDPVKNSRDIYSENKKTSFSFDKIVNSLTKEPYQAENFQENEKGKLYTISVKPFTDQRINFAVDFQFDDNQTNVLIKGFNRYEREGKKTRIAAWCNQPEILEIFVLGEDIELNFRGYKDGKLKEETDLFSYQIETEELDLKSYILEYINNNSLTNNLISEVQLYNLYANFLDEYLSQNRGCVLVDELRECQNIDRVFVLLYNIDFLPESVKKVKVEFQTVGTMDMTKTTKPLYTFDYILNPAKNWREFKNLHIKIITPSIAPYIIKSSVEFTQEDKNHYTATLSELPEDDLSFTLYENEKITFLDRFLRKTTNFYSIFYFLLVQFFRIILFLGIILIGYKLLIKWRKKS